MAVTIYKAGKYRTLAGKKISKNYQWVTLPSNAKIKANGKWYKLGFKSSSSSDLPDIDVPDFDFPDLPELNGPSLTEETLLHLNVTEPTTGTVWYMTPNGNGNMDGTSWENAFASSNIHVLMLSVSNGDRVYMSEGDYGVPTRSITIPEGISIYGGFIENDYSWETRDSFNHQTVWRGNGEFALFDLTSENTAQTIDGITCENFKNAIGESRNCTFRNMVLIGGTFSISSGLNNSKSSNCELTIGGNVEKLYNVCNEIKHCTISGNLKNSTINLENGNLIALETQNVYVSNCNAVNVQSLSDSEIVNCKETISENMSSNIKCYGGNITSNGLENIWCDKNASSISENDCTNCVVKGDLTSGGSCIDCNVEGSLTCENDCTNCQIKGDLTSGGSCLDCNVEGNLTCESNCTNCMVKGNIDSKNGSCENCVSNGNLICYGDCKDCETFGDLTSLSGSCINCKSKANIRAKVKCFDCEGCGIYSENSEGCICYESYGVKYGDNDIVLNSQIYGSAQPYKTDDSVECDYYILDGYLYYKDNKQVGTESGWTNISGHSSSSSSYYAYGIRNGYLYALMETDVTQVGTESGWTNISGHSSSSSSSYYVYGIRNGYLYALKEKTATQVGTENGWTHVSGPYYSYYSTYAYGIRNGYLYALNKNSYQTLFMQKNNENKYFSDNSVQCDYYILDGYLYHKDNIQVGTESGWTHVSGYSYSMTSPNAYAYGIRNGYLYALKATTATQVGTESGWTNISGYSDSEYSSSTSTYTSVYAYGIRNGYLYALNKTTATQVGTESGWTHISGYSNSSHYAHGIREGYLYALNKTTAKLRIGNDSNWTKTFGYRTQSGTFKAYGINDGYLYVIKNLSAKKVSKENWWVEVGISSGDYSYGIMKEKLYALNGKEIVQTGSTQPYQTDDSVGCDYYILDGYLYYKDNTQVGTESGWTNVSGHSDSSSSSYYFYGIRNGYLYALNKTTATQISTEFGWIHVSGYSDSSRYAYGISNGYLYALNQKTATQVGTESGWAHISGYSDSSHYAYGIRNGYLYALSETTATQVGTERGWTHISGYSTTSYSHYAYGIRNGYLYALKEKTVTQVGTESGWTNISGGSYDYTSSSSYFYDYAYGIREGYLYALKATTATQVGTESGWTNISGFSYASDSPISSYYAYGIRNGYLYALKATTATQVGTESGWTNVSGHFYTSIHPSSSDSYAYGIRNGYLYVLKETTATIIEITENEIGSGISWSKVSNNYAIGDGCLYLLGKNKNSITQIDSQNTWTDIFGGPYAMSDGYLYMLSDTANLIGIKMQEFENCVFSNFTNDSGYSISIKNSKFFNSKGKFHSSNSLVVNCEGNIERSQYSTIVNSNANVGSGNYNVFWNNDGTIIPENNAQSEYNESNLLTLEYDNSIARFTSTGYYPAIGVQDLGDCPNPITDQEGYNAYVSSFGNWIPQSNTFLKGKGIKDEDIPNDLNGNPRPDSPTLGAYEPLSN